MSAPYVASIWERKTASSVDLTPKVNEGGPVPLTLYGGLIQFNTDGTIDSQGAGGSITPAGISGCHLWLDATLIEGLNDGDPVEAWEGAGGTIFDAAGALAPTIQKLNIVGASSGQYELSSANDTTDPLAWDASAGAVQAALEALSDVGAGKVTVAESAQIYTITFDQTLGHVPELTTTQDTLDVAPFAVISQPGFTADNFPTYTAVGLNGLPVVSFDPSVTPQFLSFAQKAFLKSKTGLTMFLVGRATAASYFFYAHNGTLLGTKANPELRLALENDGSAAGIYAAPDDTDDQAGVLGPHATPLGGAETRYMILGGRALWLSDGQFGSSFCGSPGALAGELFDVVADSNLDAVGPSSNTNSQGMYLGFIPRNNPLAGDIGEVIVYDRPLNALEQRQVLEYLSAKWAL